MVIIMTMDMGEEYTTV